MKRIGLIATLFCFCLPLIKAQKSIDSIRVSPPYSKEDLKDLARITENGSEIYFLIPVKGKCDEQGYSLTTTRTFREYFYDCKEGVRACALDSLMKMPIDVSNSFYRTFPLFYDSQIAWVKGSTCELIDTYFGEDGYLDEISNPYVIFVMYELIKRGVHMYPDRRSDFSLDYCRYCCK